MKEIRSILIVLTACFVLTQIGSYCFSADKGETELLFTDFPENLKIMNAEQNNLSFYYDSDEEEQTVGDLRYSYNDWYSNNDGESQWYRVKVQTSNEFFFINRNGGTLNDFYVKIKNESHPMTRVYTTCCENIKIDKNGINIASEKGTDYDSEICIYKKKEKTYYTISVTSDDDLSVCKEESGVSVHDIKKKFKISIQYNKKFNERYIYPLKSEVVVTHKNGKINIRNGVILPSKTTKIITNVYLRSVNSGNNMFLTWNKVKGAKSYVVYRYSPVKNEYVKVAVRNSHNANYFNVSKADSKIGYKYKIVAKSKTCGKGKKVCADSYAVWAVADGNSKGNVISVMPNKKSLNGKVGKNAKLKATVKTTASKKVLSKTIRWYSSNKKIAKINKKTGKVKFIKKGKCYIWAKAHNGKNSKKVKVVVK